MKLAIIGLGYVGLPLATAFARRYRVCGFDVQKERIEELQRGEDRSAARQSQGRLSAAE